METQTKYKPHPLLEYLAIAPPTRVNGEARLELANVNLPTGLVGDTISFIKDCYMNSGVRLATGSSKVVLPISGLDSATIFALANKGLSGAQIEGVFVKHDKMTDYEQEDLKYAREIAKGFGRPLREIDASKLLKTLNEATSPHEDAKQITEMENLVRARAILVQGYQRGQDSCLNLSTGNHTEEMLGQATFGNYRGNVYVLGSLFKTEIRSLAKKLGVSGAQTRPKITSELNCTTRDIFGETEDIIDPILYHLETGMPIKDIMDLGHDPKWIENIVKRVAAQKERFYQDIATKEQSRLASQFQEKLERAREKYMPKPIYKPEVLPPKRETPRPTSEWTYTGGFGSK